MASNSIFDEELQQYLITNKTEAKEIEPLIVLDDSIFSVKGGISLITGLPKGGKTTALRIMIETGLMQDFYDGYDNLRIRSIYTPDTSIVYANTEMTDSDMVKLRNQIIANTRSEALPSCLHLFHLVNNIAPRKRLDVIEKALQQAENTQLLFIDQCADLVKSVNDEVECNETVQRLQDIAQRFELGLITVVHENRGNQQTRGHLGQQLERKCVSQISIKKIREKKLFEIKCGMTRHSDDFDSIFYHYNKEGRLQLIDNALREVMQHDKKKEEMQFCKLVFGLDSSLSDTDLRTKLRKYYREEKPDIKDNALSNKVKRTIDYWFESNFVDIGENKHIVFNQGIEELY